MLGQHRINNEWLINISSALVQSHIVNFVTIVFRIYTMFNIMIFLS